MRTPTPCLVFRSAVSLALALAWLAMAAMEPASADEPLAQSKLAHQDECEPFASSSKKFLDDRPKLRGDIRKTTRYQDLVKDLPRVTLRGRTFHTAEGDILLDEDQLYVYAIIRAQQVQATQPLEGGAAALVGITEGGRVVRWEPGAELKYCVLKKTFAKDEDYRLVVANMGRATEDWKKTCDVQFRHVPDRDETPDDHEPTGVLFSVRRIDAGGGFIASSFFPTYPKDRRHLLIDPSYFMPKMDFDRVGVLRHELGHILGFRHEHIRSGAPPDCPSEKTKGTFDLGKYDPKSVMHYFCGGVGSKKLLISDLDREGSQRIYGQPLDAVRYIKVD